jgi:hypothetical protein
VLICGLPELATIEQVGYVNGLDSREVENQVAQCILYLLIVVIEVQDIDGPGKNERYNLRMALSEYRGQLTECSLQPMAYFLQDGTDA